MKLSIVIPAYNEEENVKILYHELNLVLKNFGADYEIIFINDGSSDNTFKELKRLSDHDQRLKIINFIHNFGQTAAISAGIENAKGEIIISLDADLQNDPADIPKLMEKINQGYDVVSGWRKARKDKLISRKVPSWIANRLIKFITGVKIHDYGCTMKAYRGGLIKGLIFYGEMHRFIPAYAQWQGSRLAEIEVNHRPRIHGATNYTLSRIFKVILDLIFIKFLFKYMNRPMHFFGGIGFVSLFVGLTSGLAALSLKVFGIRSFVSTPLPIFSALFIIVGVQLIAMGIIAEILMRTYYESQNKKPYIIKEKINFN